MPDNPQQLRGRGSDLGGRQSPMRGAVRRPAAMMTAHRRPALTWPTLTEDQAHEVVSQDLRMVAGAPAGWWRGDTEVLVATANPDLAARVADELARQDYGRGYLSLVPTGVRVDGPFRAVLVGEVGNGNRLDWRACGPRAPYALLICLVRPTYAENIRDYVADLDNALTWEDTHEDAGVLYAEDRRTCRPCQTWATARHLASPTHCAALRDPGGRPT
jgi:hypothetical protein